MIILICSISRSTICNAIIVVCVAQCEFRSLTVGQPAGIYSEQLRRAGKSACLADNEMWGSELLQFDWLRPTSTIRLRAQHCLCRPASCNIQAGESGVALPSPCARIIGRTETSQQIALYGRSPRSFLTDIVSEDMVHSLKRSNSSRLSLQGI